MNSFGPIFSGNRSLSPRAAEGAQLHFGGFDKLSNLRELLLENERMYPMLRGLDLRQPREGVISGLGTYANSRFHLGPVLRAYRSSLKAEHIWIAAAKIIAAAIDRNERTIFRMIEDYERAERLPEITIQAMLDQSVDPAANRNAGIVEDLVGMPAPESQEDAAAAVAAVVEQRTVEKRGNSRKERTKDEFEAFADRIVKQFEKRYRMANFRQRDREVQCVLERVINSLGVRMRALRHLEPEGQEAA